MAPRKSPAPKKTPGNKKTPTYKKTPTTESPAAPIGGKEEFFIHLEEDLLSSNTRVDDIMSPINVFDRVKEDERYQREFLFKYRCCNVCCPW